MVPKIVTANQASAAKYLLYGLACEVMNKLLFGKRIIIVLGERCKLGGLGSSAAMGRVANSHFFEIGRSWRRLLMSRRSSRNTPMAAAAAIISLEFNRSDSYRHRSDSEHSLSLALSQRRR